MKRKILTFIFALCLIIPAAFVFTACSTTKEDNVQIRVQDGYVQWSSDDSDWENVITIDEILDAIGDDITGPQGVAGKQVEFNVSNTHIQWRYVGDTNWNNLIALEDIKGDNGKDSTAAEYTVTYDYGFRYVNDYMFYLYDNYKTTTTIKSTEWITNMPTPNNTVSGKFDGWYIKGTDKKIENYDFIGGDVTLEARWTALPSGMYTTIGSVKNYYDWKYVTDNWIDITNGILKCKTWGQEIKGDKLLVIDNSVTELAEEAFRYTVGEASDSFGNLCEVFIPESVTKIGSNAFIHTDIKSIIIPDSVTEIGSGAFANCNELKSVVLPNGLTELSSGMFSSCTSLTEIELPDSLTTIGTGAFGSCTSLTEIELPDSLTTISHYAFNECISLNKLIIPASVTNINVMAFTGCDNLKTVLIASSQIANSITSQDVFGNLILNAETVYIKSGLSVENSTYLLQNYTKQETSDISSYDMYVKNS